MPRAFFALIIISALALGGCWEGVTREVLATLLSARGEVVDLSNTSDNRRAIDSASRLGAGSILATSSDAQANLLLIPGALIRLLGESEFKIEQLELTKDGNETGDAMRERVARVDLRRGGMVVLFDGFAKFTIDTTKATITVLPSCLLRVDVDPNRTRLTCVRGKVYVTPQSGEITTVDGGSFREWPSKGTTVSLTEDAQGQKDTAAALQVARELQELEAAHRDRLPIN
jgi:hypothetical protein